jgi:hypothetical protein
MMMARDAEDSEEDIFKVELEDVDSFVDHVHPCLTKAAAIDAIAVKFTRGVLLLSADLQTR